MKQLFEKVSLPQQNVHLKQSVWHYFWNAFGIICCGELMSIGALFLFEWLFSIHITGDNEILFQLFGTLLTVIIFVLVQKKEDQRSWMSLGLIKKDFLKHYVLGHVIGMFMLSGALFITYLFGGVTFEGMEMKDPFLIFLFFIAFMIQGFEEELLCRGFVMYGLGYAKSSTYAILINSLFFALLHLGNDGLSVLSFLNLVVCGISFSLMAVYFDDIWVASGAHSMWNFAQGNFYGILVSGINVGPSVFRFHLQGSHLIAGGLFGLEGGIGTTFIEILSIVVLCYVYMRKIKRNV